MTKLPINRDTATAVAMLAGVALVLYFVAKREVGAGARALGNAVNPLNPDNVFARSTDALGGSLTGDPSWSLGSWLYDQFNPPYNPNAPAPSTRKIQVGEQRRYYAALAESE